MVTTSKPVISQFEYVRARFMDRLLASFRFLSNAPLARVSAVIAICSMPAFFFIARFSVTDPDIWWHLATGRWILQHHAIPRTDPFSAYGIGKEWINYSWAFDVVVEWFYRWFGFVGIVLYQIIVQLVLAIALFQLVRSLLPHFWRSIAVTALGLFALDYIVGPRPGMLTVFFAILELGILLSVRRTGNTRRLWALPPMLLLWANWHIQFVYGLMLLGVFATEPILNRILLRGEVQKPAAPSKSFWIALLASVFATCVNPAGPFVYSIVLELMHQPKVYALVDELRSMSFRSPQHYVAMFLALGAAMAIGWRRDRRLLWPILLSISAIVAFRSVKEIWFLATISTCAIADGWVFGHIRVRPLFSFRERLLVAVGILAVLVIGWRRYDLSSAWVEMGVAGNFPEVASQYIEKHRLQGPLFNDFNWGGFLIWRLPGLPVAMDGRTNVHDDESVAHSLAVWNGKPEWAQDPELASAKIILAKKTTALASILRLDPRFKIVFEDQQAILFQPR